MADYTSNLRLKLPWDSEFFDIGIWNYNTKILDNTFALIRDYNSEGITADQVEYDNRESGLLSENVQDAIDELVTYVVDSNVVVETVTSDMTIVIPTDSYMYVVLTFGANVPTISFEQSNPQSGLPIYWENGEPLFLPNSTFELSFLKLNCKWTMRNNTNKENSV